MTDVTSTKKVEETSAAKWASPQLRITGWPDPVVTATQAR